MLTRLILLFVTVPLVELVLLYELASVISLPYTVLLVIATGIIGASLARWQGLQTIHRIRQSLARNELPGEALVDALLIFVAGALLLTPGILTDAVGFSLLLPACRSWMRKAARRYISEHVEVVQHTSWQATPRSEVIDSYVIEPNEPPASQELDDGEA